jgi:membrane protein
MRDFIQRITNIPGIAFIIRVADKIGKDNAGDMAAGIAYYAFLAVFPLLLGVIALLGLFLPSETVRTQIFDFFQGYFPGSAELIERNIDSIIASRGAIGIISIILLLWTGSAIFGALGRVINKAWNVQKYRPFYIRKPGELAMALSIGLLFLLSMAAAAFSSVVPALDSLAMIASRIAAFVLLFITVALLYKFMPNTKTSWRCIWLGAILAAVLFEIARTAFAFFLSNFATYDIVYGSLEAVIVLLVWIYLSAFILIIGAEFSYEYGRTLSRSRD